MINLVLSLLLSMMFVDACRAVDSLFGILIELGRRSVLWFARPIRQIEVASPSV